MTDLGSKFVKAVAVKDRDGLRVLLAPGLDFKAVTPGGFWEATSADQVVDDVIAVWFGPDDHIDKIESIEQDRVVDRERVGYRLRVTNHDGPHVVEHQAYFHVENGRIDWLRIMCAGYQPVPE